MKLQFLPTSVKELKALGWDELDVILFTGDAYVDHPSFGVAVIGRLLEKMGLRVAIVPQPNWKDDLRDFKKLGKPNLFFGVTGGNMDSMVNHYTANKRLRSDDAYTAGGKAGFRPDYSATVYTRILKQIYPDVPVVLGGIEASLRRLCHYDYWSDTVKPSILIESGADLLLYGMAEKTLKELVLLLQIGVNFDAIVNLKQTAYVLKKGKKLWDTDEYPTIKLNSFEKCKKDKLAYNHNFKVFEVESNKMIASRLTEPTGDQLVVVNPPFPGMEQDEIDEIYDLPYTRLPHPRYEGKGDIPAFEMIKNSINTHRGCFGGCAFCTISAHQGKFVQSRSEKSILKEVEQVTQTPYFNGTISDLGGPSANMYKMKGRNLKACEMCERPSCIHPDVCPNLNTDHTPMVDLLKKASLTNGLKHLYVGSGIRYDLIYGARNENYKKSGKEFIKQVVANHVSGRLKVAPEHTSEQVLNLMRKPSFEMFKRMKADFDQINRSAGKNQQLIPYFISSHPGSKLEDMADLAIQTKQMGYKLEQVQDFTPTPMTLATCIFYTGIDPYTGKKVYTAKSAEDKIQQQSFFFWYKPGMFQTIRQLFSKINRADLSIKLLGR